MVVRRSKRDFFQGKWEISWLAAKKFLRKNSWFFHGAPHAAHGARKKTSSCPRARTTGGEAPEPPPYGGWGADRRQRARARARARAKYKVEHVPNKIAPRSASKIRQNRKAVIIFTTYFLKKNHQNYPTEGWCSNSKPHVAPGLNEKSQIWTYLKRDFLRFFRNFERSWNFWVASWNFKARLKIFNEFKKSLSNSIKSLCFDQPRESPQN